MITTAGNSRPGGHGHRAVEYPRARSTFEFLGPADRRGRQSRRQGRRSTRVQPTRHTADHVLQHKHRASPVEAETTRRRVRRDGTLGEMAAFGGGPGPALPPLAPVRGGSSRRRSTRQHLCARRARRDSGRRPHGQYLVEAAEALVSGLRRDRTPPHSGRARTRARRVDGETYQDNLTIAAQSVVSKEARACSVLGGDFRRLQHHRIGGGRPIAGEQFDSSPDQALVPRLRSASSRRHLLTETVDPTACAVPVSRIE